MNGNFCNTLCSTKVYMWLKQALSKKINTSGFAHSANNPFAIPRQHFL